MTADAVEVTSEVPPGYGPEAMIRFFPEYTHKHPLWFSFGYPDLADLQLPADLAARLQRWSAYWDTTFHWDDGWPTGAPQPWWTEEEQRLPHDIALAFGSDFLIEANGRYLHSTSDARFPASATALHALIDTEVVQQQQIQADIAAGAQYDFVAGGTSYKEWLARRQQDEAPEQ